MNHAERTVESLHALLKEPPTSGAVLALPAVLKELGASCSDTRIAFAGQRLSLLEDLRASTRNSDRRPALRLTRSFATSYEARQLLWGQRRIRANAVLAASLEAVHAFEEKLQRSETIRSAWLDFVVAVRRSQSLDTMWSRHQLLFAILEAAGHDTEACRQELQAVLLGTSGPGSEANRSATHRRLQRPSD